MGPFSSPLPRTLVQLQCDCPYLPFMSDLHRIPAYIHPSSFLSNRTNTVGNDTDQFIDRKVMGSNPLPMSVDFTNHFGKTGVTCVNMGPRWT